MIGILIVVAVVISINCAVKRRRKRTLERETLVPPPPVGPPAVVAGRGWSLVQVETSGPIDMVRPSDPTVHPSVDIALPVDDHDIN